MPRNIKVSPIDTAIARILNGEYHRYPGVTRDTIATATGIPITTVQRLFTGKSAWSTSQFVSVVNAIGTTTPADDLFRQAIEILPAVEAELSEAEGTVSEINQRRGYEWAGEEDATENWEAVAKDSETVIEVNPDDHTP